MYTTIDTIPNSILPGQAPRPCNECGVAIHGSHVEVRRFESVSKTRNGTSELLCVECLDCADLRDANELAHARENRIGFYAHVTADIKEIRGVRVICDGAGTKLMDVLSAAEIRRLPSGDTQWSLRAKDASGQEWYGRATSLGYGSQGIYLRPCARED